MDIKKIEAKIFLKKMNRYNNKKNQYRHIKMEDGITNWCEFCKNAKWIKGCKFGICKNPNNPHPIGVTTSNEITLMAVNKMNPERAIVIRHTTWCSNGEECPNFKPNICFICGKLRKYDLEGNFNREYHQVCKISHIERIKLPITAIIISIIAIIVSIFATIN